MKILIEESVVRQALENAEWIESLRTGGMIQVKCKETITSLRSAIEQSEKVKPVAWMYSEDTRGGTGVISFERLSHYANEVPLYTHCMKCWNAGFQNEGRPCPVHDKDGK